jgi:hypothetical protein
MKIYFKKLTTPFDNPLHQHIRFNYVKMQDRQEKTNY